MENLELIKIFANHVKEIEAIKNLWYGNYNYEKANELLQRTKMFSGKYFSLKHYGMELIPIRFEPLTISKFTTVDEYRNSWNDAIIKLLSIAKAMLDDVSLTPQTLQVKVVDDSSKINQLTEQIRKSLQENENLKSNFFGQLNKKDSDYTKLSLKFKSFKKWILFILLLVVLSTILWSFNSIIKWNWLSQHPKKIALYISFQFLIIFSLLRIVTSNKAIKVIDILIALLILILSLI